MTYYKIINFDENDNTIDHNLIFDEFKDMIDHEHENGYNYVPGLNIFVGNFNIAGDYNGFCFCSIDNIFDFSGNDKYSKNGLYLKSVKLPTENENFKIRYDDNSKKYYANMIILGKQLDLSDISTIKKLISEGANIHVNDDYFLRWTCQKGYLPIVKLLVELGANMNACDGLPLINSCEYGHLEIIKYLVENGADLGTDNLNENDDSALDLCCMNGHLEIIKYLAENGMDIHVDDDGALFMACSFKHLNIVKYLVENGADINNRYQLESICSCADLNTIKYLVESGVDFNDYGYLATCCKRGDLEIVKYLVEAAAGEHIDKVLLDTCARGFCDIVKYLVESAANISDNNDALLVASEYGRVDVVKYLIEQKIDVCGNNNYVLKASANNGRIYDNNLSFQSVIYFNKWSSFLKNKSQFYFEIIKLLVEAGADVNADNGYALRISSEKKRDDVVKYLIEQGADTNVKKN